MNNFDDDFFEDARRTQTTMIIVFVVLAVGIPAAGFCCYSIYQKNKREREATYNPEGLPAYAGGGSGGGGVQRTPQHTLNTLDPNNVVAAFPVQAAATTTPAYPAGTNAAMAYPVSAPVIPTDPTFPTTTK